MVFSSGAGFSTLLIESAAQPQFLPFRGSPNDLDPRSLIMLDSLATLTHPYATSDVWDPGAHIGTFRGNQLAFAAGAAAVYRVSIGVPTTVGA